MHSIWDFSLIGSSSLTRSGYSALFVKHTGSYSPAHDLKRGNNLRASRKSSTSIVQPAGSVIPPVVVDCRPSGSNFVDWGYDPRKTPIVNQLYVFSILRSPIISTVTFNQPGASLRFSINPAFDVDTLLLLHTPTHEADRVGLVNLDYCDGGRFDIVDRSFLSASIRRSMLRDHSGD